MSKDAGTDKFTGRKVALATLQGSYQTHGLPVDVSVSPCSWMYEGYGFQIGYEMPERRCWGHCIDKALTVETATRADVQRMLDADLRAQPCARCTTPFLFNTTDRGSNRGTLCETCWMDDFNKENERHMEKENRALARKDAAMAKKGYTHRVSAWVHPARGGDDYLIDFYSKKLPTPCEIEALLRKEGSRRLDDYGIVALTK